MRTILAILTALCGAADAPGAASVEDALRFSASAATVLVFVDTECPIANAMAPELERIHRDFQSKGVRMFRVYAGPDYEPAAIARHAEDFGYTFPAVADTDLALVKHSGARITPEAVVYDTEGARRYRGRIKNLFEDLGVRRRTVTEHDLRNALEALLEHRDIPRAEAPAVGCYLPKVGGASKETLREDPES
jgi:hypothetical protein